MIDVQKTAMRMLAWLYLVMLGHVWNRRWETTHGRAREREGEGEREKKEEAMVRVTTTATISFLWRPESGVTPHEHISKAVGVEPNRRGY